MRMVASKGMRRLWEWFQVIRVYDQKKRHQMVRELKSLYVNFVPINDTASKAACEELVVFYDAYTNPEIGSVSIVLEFMNGGSLEDHLQSGRRVSERELANMAYCVLKGLAFLHEHHQLHRDIKLSNMLINNEGQVKVKPRICSICAAVCLTCSSSTML